MSADKKETPEYFRRVATDMTPSRSRIAEQLPSFPDFKLDTPLDSFETQRNVVEWQRTLHSRLGREIQIGLEVLSTYGISRSSYEQVYYKRFEIVPYMRDFFQCVLPGTLVTANYCEVAHLARMLLELVFQRRVESGESESGIPQHMQTTNDAFYEEFLNDCIRRHPVSDIEEDVRSQISSLHLALGQNLIFEDESDSELDEMSKRFEELHSQRISVGNNSDSCWDCTTQTDETSDDGPMAARTESRVRRRVWVKRASKSSQTYDSTPEIEEHETAV